MDDSVRAHLWVPPEGDENCRGASAPTGIRGRTAARIATAAVMAVAMAVRLGPLLRYHALSGVIENDDGVYYNAAVHLAAGRIPYRDFVFLQPPGIAVLLTPFAAPARLVGDPAAMSAARLGVVLAAAVNVALLMRLMRRQVGPVAAVAAGTAYAVWGGAVSAERTVLLEPLIGLALLGAMTLASGGERTGTTFPAWRLAAAGGVLGLGMALKTWAVLDVIVLAAWVAWRRGRLPSAGTDWAARVRAAATLAGAALASATVVCLPFFIVAPRAMVHQVVTVQLHRTTRFATSQLMFRHDLTGIGPVYSPIGAGLVVAVTALIAVGAAAVTVTFWRGPRVWAVLAVTQIALVVTQVTFTYHYTNFAAPAIAACAGTAFSVLISATRRIGGWPRHAGTTTCAAAGVVAAVLLAWQSASVAFYPAPHLPHALSRFFAAHPCTFADYPSVLPAADAETRQFRLGCGNLVDYSGAALSVSGGSMLVPYPTGGRYRAPAWQAQVRAILAHSDAAVRLTGDERWTPQTWALFHSRFKWAGNAGLFTLWVLRRGCTHCGIRPRRYG